MAREIVSLSPGKCELREVDDPLPAPGEVLIRSEFGAAKHGTEMAAVKGYGRRGRYDNDLQLFVQVDSQPAPDSPHVVRVGNMVVGQVEVLGDRVDTLSVGDRVAAHSSFRDLTTREASKCWKLEPEISWQDAVCLDPADFAMAAVRDGQVRIGDAVAVFGLGAIGLMVIQVARLAGAHPIIGLDPLMNRREAGVACGADYVIDPANADAGMEIKLATSNRGADVIVEYSGSVHAMQAALRGVAFGGTVVAGAYPPPYGAGLDLGAEAHLNRPNIAFSRACSEPNRDYPRWDEERLFENCRRLFREGKVTGQPIVSPIFPVEEIVTEYPKIVSDPGSNIKLGCKV